MQSATEAMYATISGSAAITALIGSGNVYRAWPRGHLITDVLDGTLTGVIGIYYTQSGTPDYDEIGTPAMTMYVDVWTQSPSLNAQILDALRDLLSNKLISSGDDRIFCPLESMTETIELNDLHYMTTTWRLVDAG